MLSLGYKEELCYHWGKKRSSMLSLGYKEELYVITGV